jgi:hypothetical protein
MYNPGIGIMTVPARTALVIKLVNELQNQGINPYISIDNQLDGTWANWKNTAKLIQKEKHTHALILQDDVILCNNFYKEYINILSQEPIRPICLFTPYKLPRGLYIRKYVVSAQGISIPVDLLDNLFNWVDANYKPHWKFDDSRLNAWSHGTKNHFVYPIPTIIDHNTDIDSTLGHVMMAKGKPWKSLDFKGLL